MAELTLSASDIAAAITKGLDGYKPSTEARTVGRVTEVGDGIARVSGLPDCAVNELLEFEGGVVGLALNLDEDSIGAVAIERVLDRPIIADQGILFVLHLGRIENSALLDDGCEGGRQAGPLLVAGDAADARREGGSG